LKIRVLDKDGGYPWLSAFSVQHFHTQNLQVAII